MSDYKIDIRAQLSGFEEIESKINSLKSKLVDIKVNLQGANGDLSKQLQSQMAGVERQFGKSGQSAGRTYTTALQRQIETMARTQRNAFSQPLGNMTKEQSSYINWWEKQLTKFSQRDATMASNKTLAWLKNNSKAAKDYGDVLTDLATKQKLSTNPESLKEYTKQVNAIKAEAASLGKVGKSVTEELSRGFKQIGQFVWTYGGLQQTVNVITNSIGELKSIDGILTEISKTSDLTTGQLKTLGETSFDSASKYGKKASDYLTGVQEMSRSGYYGDKAEEMAQLSVLAQAAGDINANAANSYLLASNAAYQYQGNVQKLTTVLDGQNMITNRNSVSMADMAEATTKAASMASELGVQENQLSAMIGTIESRTKAGGDEVGTALKSLLINVENINNAKIADTFKEAGVAQTEYVNGVERMRNPVDILKDLAVVFNSLEESDPLRTDILTNIGQKWQANKLSALLSGWSDYEKMLKDYSEGTGSAAIEAEKSANNWEGATNKLSNTFTGFMQNFVNTDGIIGTTNAITGLVSGFDTLTSKIGPLSLALGGLGLFQGAKGGGKRWKYRPAFIKSTYATGEFSGDVYELCTT